MKAHLNHPYHMVSESPWPLAASMGLLFTTVGLAGWFHLYDFSLIIFGLVSIGLSAFQWWRDMVREATMQGAHTIKVIKGLQFGMVLFIISEVLFFASFFWAFFHSSLNPTMEIGGSWPPTGVYVFNPFQVPLLNTAILLASGVSVTWAHHSLISSDILPTLQGLLITVILGLYFTGLQAMEYFQASFSISDSVYGSTFFVATGFHGLHVIIGSTFLTVCLIRSFYAHFSSKHHFGFEASIWYWHFVDVVWLFLFVSIYWWGSCTS
uniref:Cytochrome c oxidase subunit 3 n=1 Tax=Bactrurus brachycaudus TaxID=111554 RepID=A0A6C0X577_9CRUS|nr:cytochrome c oxidase subunit III [Bactrurus brachycaudus]QIC54384.1 cytochrome c oxidase subunit III [Bactrurus brachycaudus]